MGKIYLLTGVGGHVGGNVAKQLLDSGQTVRGFALPREDVTMLYGEGISIVRGDIRNKASIAPLFFGLNADDEVIVIHAAGLVSIRSGYDKRVMEVNVTGTKNIVELCLAHKVDKLVYVSSVHAIPEQPEGVITAETLRFDPAAVKGLYAKSKAEATRIALDAAKDGLFVTVVQPTGVIGPGDYRGLGHMTQLVKSFMDGRLTVCVDGGFDFVDVRDVSRAIIAAAEKGRKGECYILSNRYYNVRELLTKLHALTGKKDIRMVLPIWIAKLAAPFCEFFALLRHEAPLFTAYSLNTLKRCVKFSSAKARRELGFVPRDMQQTLRDTVAFVRARSKKNKVKRLRLKKAPARV